jgi:hypothetical protein
MRKLIAAAVLLLMAPAVASAQGGEHQYRGQGYFVFGMGTASAGGEAPDLFVVSAGGGGEFFVYKGLGMGAEASYAHLGRGPDLQAWIASGDLSYHFDRNARRGKTDPFVVLGVSGFFPTRGLPAGNSVFFPDESGRGEPAGNFGGGVNLWFAKRVGLRFEVRDYIQEYASSGPGHDVSFRVGISLR